MKYTEKNIKKIVDNQKEFFLTNETLDIDFRITQLNKLKEMILSNQDIIEKALIDDLGRSDTEAYLCDIGPTIIEINEAIRNLKKWAKPETHFQVLCVFLVYLRKSIRCLMVPC